MLNFKKDKANIFKFHLFAILLISLVSCVTATYNDAPSTSVPSVSFIAPAPFNNILSTVESFSTAYRNFTNFTLGASLQYNNGNPIVNTRIFIPTDTQFLGMSSHLQPFAGKGASLGGNFEENRFFSILRLKQSDKGKDYVIYSAYTHDMTFKVKEDKGDFMWLVAIDDLDMELPVSMLYAKGTTSLANTITALPEFNNAHGSKAKLNITTIIYGNDYTRTLYLVDHEDRPLTEEEQFLADPYSKLQPLPTAFTALYPIPNSDRIKYSVANKFTGYNQVYDNAGKSETWNNIFGEIGDTLGFIEDNSLKTIQIGPPLGSFYRGSLPFISRYTGNDTSPNGTTVTSGDLWDKLFTLTSGLNTVHFGFFDHPGKGIKIYSYDPDNNILTEFEGKQTASTSTANGNVWYRLTDLTIAPATHVFEVHLR